MRCFGRNALRHQQVTAVDPGRGRCAPIRPVHRRRQVYRSDQAAAHARTGWP
jgi:hypothetical protein